MSSPAKHSESYDSKLAEKALSPQPAPGSGAAKEKIKRLIAAEYRVLAEAKRRLKAQRVAKFMNDMISARPNIVKHIQSLYEKNHVEEIREFEFLPKANPRPAKSCSTLDHNNHRQHAPLFLLSAVVGVPSARTWCPLKKNLFIEDQRELPYLPYFENEDGDSSTFLSELLEQQYEGRLHLTPVLALPAEQNKETLTELFQNLLAQKSKLGDLNDLPALVDDAIPELEWKVAQLTDLMNHIQNSKPEQQGDVCLPDIDGPDAGQTNPERALNSYMMLFCGRCFRYDCHLHPYMVPQGERKKPAPQPAVDLFSPCGSDCFKIIAQRSIGENGEMIPSPTKSPSKAASRKRKSNADLGPGASWHPGELLAMRVMALQIFGADYCRLAQCLLKPCREVYEVALHENLAGMVAKHVANTESGGQVANGGESGSEGNSNMNLAKNRKNKLDKSSKNWLKKLWTLQKKTQQNSENGAPSHHGNNGMPNPYEPCGACGDRCEPATCKCHLSGNFCEKFCQCQPDQCRYRFPGCRCEQCTTSRCPCLAANRECDPDVCRPCQNSYVNSTVDFDLKKFNEEPMCRNVSIQRGQGKRLLVAPSDIAGWGCFVRDPVERHEFIAEYVGELITQEEAERRGRVYDRIGTSFLFNLNSEYAVDAMRKGNKIRFANHSRQPNCFARIMLVNGDHRVGIYAKRAIAAGEELFFDYYYNREQLKFVSVERSVAASSSAVLNPSTSATNAASSSNSVPNAPTSGVVASSQASA